MVTGLITVGVYLVVTGKLRAIRLAGATQLTSAAAIPVESAPTFRKQRETNETTGVLDTIQAAVEILRGGADVENAQRIERELSECLTAAETRIAELDAMISGGDGDASVPSSEDREAKRNKVTSPQ